MQGCPQRELLPILLVTNALERIGELREREKDEALDTRLT